jgi:hemoglobin
MKSAIRAVCLATAVIVAQPILTTAQADKSLYDRLGGVFAISAVVNHFSDALIKNPIVGQTSKNASLRAWHTKNLDRLPGMKFMRTLWFCEFGEGP